MAHVVGTALFCLSCGTSATTDADLQSGDAAIVASADLASAPGSDAAASPTVVLAEGTTPLHDYRGVIAGPDPNGTGDCGYASPTTLSKRLYELGVRSIRNNDYNDDTLDFDLMFTCSGTAYGSMAPACNDQYPCWAGCTLAYPACAQMHYDTGAPGYLTSDERFDGIVSGGFEPFLRVGGESAIRASLLGGGVTARPKRGPQTTVEEDNWIEAAKCASAHYLGRHSFQYLDILTETTQNFWSRDAASLNAFWQRAYAALKPVVGPSVKLGGPGMWGAYIGTLVDAYEKPASCTAGASLPAREFLKTLYGAGTVPDWIGIHMFSPDAHDYVRIRNAFRALVTGTGSCFGSGAPLAVPWPKDYFATSELVVDAFFAANNNLDGAAVANAADYFDHKEGAALTAAAFVLFQETGVTRAFQYRDGDQALGVSFGTTRCDANATPKPRANVYRFWNRLMTDGATAGTITVPDAGQDLWLLGAHSVAHEYLLVANTGTTAQTIVPGFVIGGATKLIGELGTPTVYTIDDSNDGSSGAPLASNQLTIAPGTVALVVMAR